MILSTYARHPVTEARLNGDRVAVKVVDTEFGVGVYSIVVDLGPGESAHVQFVRDEQQRGLRHHARLATAGVTPGCELAVSTPHIYPTPNDLSPM